MRAPRDPFREGPAAASARRRRSLAIALLCVLFAALIFSVTAVRLLQNTNDQPAPTATNGGGAVR
jgi:hypothetical protein